jgi:hypothetical protein
MTYVVLRKPVLHPALVSCTVMLLAGRLIGGMVVDSADLNILLDWTRLREVLRTTLLLIWAFVVLVLEVSSFAEFCIVVPLIIFVIISSLDFDFSFLFGLFYSLLTVDGRETDILSLRVEGEERNGPVSLFIIPLRFLMKLVKLVLGKEYAHNFIAKFNGFLLCSYNIE